MNATTTTTSLRPVTETSTARAITRRAVASWVLYDLANTIFSMGVVSLFFSLWVRDQVGEARADSVYGVITSISMGAIFVVSPLLGALTDRARRRMPFLVVSTLICVGCTAVLARAGFWMTSVLFAVANIAYQAGLQFYDALLPEVSTEQNRGKIGGVGVGVGYLGSYLAVILGLVLARGGAPVDKALYFSLVAVLFLLFALPCFLFVRERGNPGPRPITLGAAVESVRETVRTLRSGKQFPGLLRFLIGRVFYTDPINTVISFMTLFVVNVAMHAGLAKEAGETRAQIIMMTAITFAVAGGFFWGWVTDRLGPKRTLDLVLKGWVGIFVLAALVGLFGLPPWTMYVVACAAGSCLGGVWAADRPYMLRLTPPDRVGEFYGLYGMVGRFSAVTGPVLWGAVCMVSIRAFGLTTLQSQGLAVLSLLVLVVFSQIVLKPVSDTPRDWAALNAGNRQNM